MNSPDAALSASGMMDNRPIDRCETVADVLALLGGAEGWNEPWQDFFAALLDGSGLSYSRFAALSGLSRNTVKAWRLEGSAPRSRDSFLKVGFGASMPPEAVSGMLSRYGGYCGLNPRDPFDAACIFCLRRRAGGGAGYRYADAAALYRRLLPEQLPAGDSAISTTMLAARLALIDTEAAFSDFFREFGAELCARKLKLERFLGDFLTMRRLEATRDGGGSLHSLQLPARVEKQLSLLKQHGVVPRRRDLIALGLHLGMTLAETDTLLEYAGMEPLSVRDRLESVVIYALQQLALTHPELALGNATGLLAVTRDAGTRRRCAALAEEYWRNGYRSGPDDVDSVARYVRVLLEHMDLEEADGLLPLL